MRIVTQNAASFALTFSFLYKLCFLFLKKVFEVRDLMVQQSPAPISLRDLALLTNYLPTPPVFLTLLSLSLLSAIRPALITLWFPPCLSLKIFIWLLASKVNVELSKRLKFSVKGFKTVSKGFSILLEKFGCGCTQQS